mgnify:CR=1 FL=1
MPKINKYSRGKLEQIIRTRSVQGDVAAALGGGGDLSVSGQLATTGSVLVSTSDGQVQGTELNIDSLNNLAGVRELTASFALISNDLTVTNNLKVGGNIIQASDGGNTITLDTSDNVAIAGDLTVNGGDISGPTDGSLTIKAETDLIFKIDSDNDGSANESFQFQNGAGTEVMSLDELGSLTVNGSLSATTASFSGGLTISGAESPPADLIFKADEGDDAGDEWRVRAGTDDTFVIGNDKASAGTYTSLLTFTGNSNSALSKAQFAGRVGVGKDPSDELDVQGDIAASSKVKTPRINHPDGGSCGTIYLNDDDIRIYGGGIRGVDVNQYKVAVNLANSDVDFEICGNSNDALLWCDADDECIGIHENDPMNALHIAHKGTSNNDGLIIVRTNYNDAGGYNSLTISDGDFLGGIGFDSQDGNIPTSILSASAFIAAYAAEDHGTGDKGGDLVFGTTTINDDDDTASHEWMRILDSGDVGIGTNAPIAKLDVAGKIAISSESSTPAQPADGKGYLYTKAGGGLYWRSYDLVETDVLDNGLVAAGELATTGSVLVSTGAGEVQGTELNIDSSNNLTLPVGSKGKAEAWQTYSSARYKENICLIEDPVEKLSKLKGVYFDWIGREDGRDIGFIAEEVGQVLPEIVTYEDDGRSAISMSYDKVVPLLVEAFNKSREREKKNKKLFWGILFLNTAYVALSAIFF